MSKIITFVKFQFLGKHWFVYVFLPLVLTIIALYYNWWNKLILESTINTTVTIIGIIWWLLLNFLVILLTSNSVIITKYKDCYEGFNFYWNINKWTKNFPNIQEVNLYDFVYYKIFFLIALSLWFIMMYLWYFLGIQDFLRWIDKIFSQYYLLKNISVVMFAKWFYLYLALLYFINFWHLIYKIYYLFHKDNTMPESIPISR